MEYFAQDEATRLDPTLTVYETLQAGSPMHMVPMIRNILGGLPLLGRRRVQAGRRAVGRRAHASGGRAHAAPPVEHAAARRADEPPRSRLEGRAARRARGLRRHAHLRVARPLLRREAGDEDHRDRPRARRSCIRARTPSSSGARNTRTPEAGADRRVRGRRRQRRESRACAPAERHAERRAKGTARAGDEPAADPTRASAKRAERKQAATREPQARRSRASPTWKGASPTASARCGSSKRRWPRPGSTSDATPPSPSSIGIRR